MSSYSNEQVEQLRVRYRQEALKAVEAAEKRAFKKGQEAAQQQIEQELAALRNDNKTLKAVVESYREQAEAQHHAKPQMRLLLRHIMEQVYIETKKLFVKSNNFTGDQVVGKMKTVLVGQAESLSRTVGDLPILAVSSTTAAATATPGVGSMATDGSTASPEQSPTHDSKRNTNSESPKHSLVPDSSSIAHLLAMKADLPNPAAAIFREFTTLPNLDIVVAIKGIEKHDSGVFGTFATYEMQSAVVLIQSISKKPLYYTCSHRYRDFDNLFAQLKKLLPHAMLPSLPPKDISVGANLHDDFVQARRRGLRLWVQHVSMHPELQRCATLAKFICGGRVPQSWPVDANLVPSKPTVRVSRRIRLNLPGKLQHGTPSVFKEEPSDTTDENATPIQSESDRERANRLVLTVSKNHAAMQQPIKAALEATSKLLNCMSEQAIARQELHSMLCQFAVTESADVQMQEAISGMAQALGKGATKYSETENVLLSHIHQPLSFYGVNCMQAAKTCVEAVSGMERDQKVDAAADLVGEWVTLRQLRHSCQLRDLTTAAEGMLELHASQQEAWQEVMATVGPSHNASPRGFRQTSMWSEAVRRRSHIQPHHDYFIDLPKQYASAQHAPLRHAAETKPIVPAGIRHLPEKIFCYMRDILSSQPQPDIRPVPGAAPAIPSTYRTSSEPYIDPFIDSSYHAYTRPAPTGVSPVPPRATIDPFAQPYHRADEASLERSSLFERPKNQSSRDGRSSTAEAGSAERSSLNGPRSTSVSASGNFYQSVNTAASATAPLQSTQSGDEDETPMSKLYKERAAEWEREQAAAQHKQRDSLMEQIKQEKELTDDIAGRRRRARANAQTKHVGQHTRLRKPTKKQAAVPQQEEYVPPAASRPVHYAGYHASLSSNVFEDHTRRSQEGIQESRQQRRSRTESLPPRADIFTSGQSSDPTIPAEDSRRVSAPEAMHDRLSTSSKQRLPDDQVEHSSEDSQEPLPEGWEEVFTADGKRYYYHTLSRASRWDRPTKESADKVAERFNASQRAVNDAVERRKKEREDELREQEQRAQRATELRTARRAQVVAWSKNKPMYLMLKECNTIVPFITAGAATTHLSGSSTNTDLKKAYMKIVRQIHPDKLNKMDLENQILGEEVFTVLTEAFDKFRSTSG